MTITSWAMTAPRNSSLHPDPTLHLQTPGGGGGQGDGYDDRGDDSKDSDDDLGDKGDDNDKLDHDSTRGHPGEGPANGEYAGKLMTWSAYVLDPRTKSVTSCRGTNP